MLIKLIKNDIKSSKKQFLGIFAAIILIFLGFFAFINFYKSDLLETNSMFLATSLVIINLLSYGVVIAIFVVAIVTIINIYNRKVFGQEGYLTMTLPVEPWQITMSKIITTGIWTLLTGIITGICCILLFVFLNSVTDVSFFTSFYEVFPDINQSGLTLLIITILIYGFIEILSTAMTIYLSITISNIRKLKKHKTFFAIILFFTIMFIESNITSNISALIFNNSSYFNSLSGDLISSYLMFSPVYTLSKFLLIPIVLCIITLTIKILVNNHLLKKHFEID